MIINKPRMYSGASYTIVFACPAYKAIKVPIVISIFIHFNSPSGFKRFPSLSGIIISYYIGEVNTFLCKEYVKFWAGCEVNLKLTSRLVNF